MVVSTAIHLQRVALTFANVFRNVPVEFLYCPVPSRLDGLNSSSWWRHPADRHYVLQETMKLAGYRAILSLHESAIRLLMPLKD
jgi:hypothetical protein